MNDWDEDGHEPDDQEHVWCRYCDMCAVRSLICHTPTSAERCLQRSRDARARRDAAEAAEGEGA